MIVKMLDAGMNVARLDFSDGDHKTHGECIENLQMALKQRPEMNCAIMMDTQGPEITLAYMRDGKPIELREGQSLKIVTDVAIEGDNQKVACTYKRIAQTVRVGSTIFIGGANTCEITETGDDFIIVKVMNNFAMKDRMKINLPGAVIDLPTLTDKDEDDIVEFGLKNNVDFVAASFVRKASDVEFVRNVLGQKGADVKIISKIETHEGLHNFDEILAESDGILISRSDLSLELPPEKLFIAQKWMVEKANLAAKPIIIATQIFESMIEVARPTRSEATEISSAVLDGIDGIVLNNETANGNYPVQAVVMLSKCCVEAEKTVDHRKTYNDLKLYSPAPYGTAESVSCAAVAAVLDLKIDLIIVLSETGKLARLVAKYRPEVAVICCSSSDAVVRSVNCTRGVIGCLSKAGLSVEDQTAFAIIQGRKMKVCKAGYKVVVLNGTNEDTPDESNVMKVMTVE